MKDLAIIYLRLYLKLLERFVASGIRDSSLRLNALDAHPNEKYNAAVAEYLASVEAAAAKPQ